MNASLLPLTLTSLLLIAALLLSSCDTLPLQPRDNDDDDILPPFVSGNRIDSYPDWSPDGKQIAYTHWPQTPEEAQNGPEMQIWILDVETGQKWFLTPGWLPDWSPDGKRIAFVQGGYEQADIYVVEVATSAVQRLTEWGWCFYPSWSPDGKRIAFDTNYGDSRGANVIWTMNADGSGKKDISQHGVGEWRMPAWSPDGSKIAYIRYTEDVHSGSAEEVFVMDTTGQNSIRLTFNKRNDRRPSWSPDGKRITWNSHGGGSDDTSGIWVMEIDGSNQRLLARRGFFPSWSPDGERVAYQRWNEEENATLWIMNADGSNQRPLTRLEDYQLTKPQPEQLNGGDAVR